MSHNEEDPPEADRIGPGEADSSDSITDEQQYIVLAEDETMPALFGDSKAPLDIRAWIQLTNGNIGLRVAREPEPIATWDLEHGWIATPSAPLPRGDNPALSEPGDLAYGLLSLGWEVTTRVDDHSASVLAKPRFAKIGGTTTRVWETLRLSPGSQILYVWVRELPEGEWKLDETKSGSTGIDGARVLVDESDAFRLALTIAPDWLMPSELDAPALWHSMGEPVAKTELPEDSYAPLAAPGAAEIAKRKAALSEWTSSEQFEGPFSDRAQVRKFLDSRDPVGHYVLAFREGGCYVGETTNFDTRFAQHERSYPERIEAFYLRRDEVAATLPPRSKQRKRQLLGVERKLIHDAQNNQLNASNFREMANPLKPWSGFVDHVDGPDEIAVWFLHPDIANQNDSASFRALSLNNFGGASDRIQQYRSLSDAQQVNRIIAAYIRRCVPFPARTELESWAISCLPAAKRGKRGVKTWSVIACLSISRTESLTILREDWSQKAVGFIAVNEIEAGLAHDGGLIRLLRRHPGVSLDHAGHREFGPGTLNLHAASLDCLEQLLNDSTITRAASTSALRLCRLGPSMHRAVHNPFLVDDALQTGRIWSQ